MPIAALLFNASVWGLSWWPVRALDGLGQHALWATSFSFLLSVIVVGSLRPGAWRDLGRHPSLIWMTIAAGTTNACFNWGVMTGDVLRVVLLFYLMPVWSLLFARWLLGEAITWSAVLRIALALAGAGIVLWRPGAGLPLPSSLSDALGVLGGASFAMFNVLVRRDRAIASTTRALAGFIGGAVVSAVIASTLAAAGTIAPPPAPAADWIALQLAFGTTLLLGNLALQYGAARLPAATTAVVMLFEVIVAAVSSWLIGGEAIGWRTGVGGVLILAATLLSALTTARARGRARGRTRGRVREEEEEGQGERQGGRGRGWRSV